MSGPRGRRTTRFEAKLASAHLDLDRLLLPAPGGREGKRGEPPDPKAFSGLSGRAEVRVDVLRMRRAELTNVLLEIRVTEDEVVLEKAQAGAFGGEISDASGRVRLAHPNDPFRLTAKLRGVELGQAIAPFSSQKIFSGKLDGQVDLSGGGRQKADLAKTLAGFLSGTVLEGTFHGKDLVAGVTAPLARALPFGAAGREAKGGGTPLGKELPFALEFADGVARLKKPLQISRPEAEIALEGGFRLDGSLDMPATVALSPQTVASLTGGKARPGAPIPVSFRLVGPAWSPTLSGLDLQPAVAAILKEAGAGALGGLLGAPPRPAPGPTPAPGPASQDAAKRLKDEAAKRLEGLFGR
jgi:AsmA protein